MNRQMLEQLINEGKSIREIALDLETSYTNVRYWLNRLDLSTKNSHHERKCLTCGETDPNKFYGNKTRACKICHNADVIRRGQEKRDRAVEKFGSRCSRCNYNECLASLDFHHLDPSKKDSMFHHWRGWSWKRVEKELSGCILLCKNCHAREHYLSRTNGT